VELVPLLVLAVFFIAGYQSRSYVGVLVPGAVVVFAVDAYRHRIPSGDEIDVLDGVFVVLSVVGVLVYLTGVALGRRVRRGSADAA
jgi:hypothetical protein